MFLVGDSREMREQRVRKYLASDPGVSLLLAAVYFEWVVGRAIVALGKNPNRRIREQLSGVYGLDKYKEFWKLEVKPSWGLSTLPGIVGNWSRVKEAFKLRGRLVHGRTRCTRNMAAPKVDDLLAGAADIWRGCSDVGCDLGRRLPVRRKEPVV